MSLFQEYKDIIIELFDIDNFSRPSAQIRFNLAIGCLSSGITKPVAKVRTVEAIRMLLDAMTLLSQSYDGDIFKSKNVEYIKAKDDIYDNEEYLNYICMLSAYPPGSISEWMEYNYNAMLHIILYHKLDAEDLFQETIDKKEDIRELANHITNKVLVNPEDQGDRIGKFEDAKKPIGGSDTLGWAPPFMHMKQKDKFTRVEGEDMIHAWWNLQSKFEYKLKFDNFIPSATFNKVLRENKYELKHVQGVDIIIDKSWETTNSTNLFDRLLDHINSCH